VKVHFGLPEPHLGRRLVSLGSFDGLHLGHQAVISKLVQCAGAEGAGATVITFEPHPRCVLDPVNCPKSITTLAEKLALLEPFGVDETVVMRFDRELASRRAAEFVQLLGDAMEPLAFVQGPDFAFGRGREGDLAWLRAHGQRVIEVPSHMVGGEEVHSSEIRRLLTLGEVERAAVLLGRHFSLSGPVEEGDRIGRELGFPTANLAIEPNKLVPGQGVYAGWVTTAGGEQLPGALSVGYRPTFAGTQLRVEAFLLDFSGDLYRQRLEIRFVARLRDEIRFDSREALVDQMALDVEETRRRLGRNG
jgi:riboflavin kinase/FMN adenylyltransferase